MFCRHCGKDNPPDARFCEQCGEELMEGFAPAQTPPPQNRAPVQDTMSGVDRWANGFDVQPGDEEEPPPEREENPLPLVLAIVGAVVVLGVGGYFGWNFFQSQSMTGAPAETPVPVSQTESSLPEETETPVPTEAPQTSESSSQEPVEKVQVIVLKEDRSITDETGGVLAKISFQKPVLQDGAYSPSISPSRKSVRTFWDKRLPFRSSWIRTRKWEPWNLPICTPPKPPSPAGNGGFSAFVWTRPKRRRTGMSRRCGE